MKQLVKISEDLKQAIRIGMVKRVLDDRKGFGIFIAHLYKSAIEYNVLEEFEECVYPRLTKCGVGDKLHDICFGKGSEGCNEFNKLLDKLRSEDI